MSKSSNGEVWIILVSVLVRSASESKMRDMLDNGAKYTYLAKAVHVVSQLIAGDTRLMTTRLIPSTSGSLGPRIRYEMHPSTPIGAHGAV